MADRSDDQVLEIALRASHEIASRMIVLGAAVRRASMERQTGEIEDDAETLRFDLTAWLHVEGLEPAASGQERGVLAARIGALPAEAIAAASWQGEAIVTLGWVLGMIDEMPSYDRAADLATLLAAIPSPWETTDPFRLRPIARSESAIANERERAELWHWRSEVAELMQTANRDERGSLLAAVREVAYEAHAFGHLASLRADDFPIAHRLYRDLRPPELDELGAIAAARLQALNWVCGFGDNWDSVPLQF